MKTRPICPKCFSDSGYSIVMEEDKGVYMCTKNSMHKYKRNTDGFFEQHKI